MDDDLSLRITGILDLHARAVTDQSRSQSTFFIPITLKMIFVIETIMSQSKF